MENSQAPASPHENVSVNRANTLRSIETRYEQMLLDEVLWYLNLVAEFAHWALLAGYLVIPGTFTSLQKSDTLKKNLDKTKAGKFIFNTIQNPPLVAIAVSLFVLGAMLTAWLFWKRKGNYIWLVNRLSMYVTLQPRWIHSTKRNCPLQTNASQCCSRAAHISCQYLHSKGRQLVNHGAVDHHYHQPFCLRVPGFGDDIQVWEACESKARA